MSEHILVVEDSPLVQRLLAVCLRDLGRPVRGVLDGPTALEDIAADPPALAILDIGLPGMDGWELLRRIRLDPQWGRLPVLVLTAHAQEEYRLEADRRGADGFMTKPFEPDALRAAVGRLLGDRAEAEKACPAPGRA
ncbi:MAG TPA: response regulator [Acidimicrobiia bacterium]|nr:response regulator [Acidimicrobiia bacterium]